MARALPASTPPHVRAALVEAKARLEALYGDRLARVILYGSYARGDARPDSDVDVLVVLRGEYEPYAEIKRMGVPLYDVALRYDLALSAQPYRVEEVADGRRPFMRNVAADGVTL